MLLQGSYFTAVDLAEIASDVDNREGRVLNEPEARSHNVDDSGYFSVQVIAEALKVFNLDLIPLSSPRARTFRDNPTLGQAYICNLNEHWFAVRRLGFQWFTLNSLLPTPRLISDTYLSLFFAQLINEGYSIFVVEGVLPPCAADEQLTQCPVDPSLAGFSDAYRDDHSQDPNTARAKAVSRGQAQEDEELRLALELSRRTLEEEDATLQATLHSSLLDAENHNQANEDDEELERQLQKAIQMSIECCREGEATAAGPSEGKAVATTSENEESGPAEETSGKVVVNEEKSTQKEEIRSKREEFLKRFD